MTKTSPPASPLPWADNTIPQPDVVDDTDQELLLEIFDRLTVPTDKVTAK